MDQQTFDLVNEVFNNLLAQSGAEPVVAAYSLSDPQIPAGSDDFKITAANGKLCFAAGNTRGLFYAVYEYLTLYAVWEELPTL